MLIVPNTIFLLVFFSLSFFFFSQTFSAFLFTFNHFTSKAISKHFIRKNWEFSSSAIKYSPICFLLCTCVFEAQQETSEYNPQTSAAWNISDWSKSAVNPHVSVALCDSCVPRIDCRIRLLADAEPCSHVSCWPLLTKFHFYTTDLINFLLKCKRSLWNDLRFAIEI